MAAKEDDALILSTIQALFTDERKYDATRERLMTKTGLDEGKVERSIARLEKAGKILCNTPRRKVRSMAYAPTS